MKDKIIEAVGKLDATNDNHWTADGLPRLETVRLLTTNPSLSRDDIETALPAFRRPTATAPNSAQATGAPASDTPTATAETSAPVSTQAQETTDETPVVLTQTLSTEPVNEDIEALQNKLEDARADLDAVNIELTEVQARQVEAYNEFIFLEDKLDKLTTAIVGNPIQAYLAQQNKDLEDRMERRKAIQESGLKLSDFVTEGPSALDRAMNSRRNRQRGVRQ